MISTTRGRRHLFDRWGIEPATTWTEYDEAYSGSDLDRADPFFGGQRDNEVFAEAVAAAQGLTIDLESKRLPVASE